MHNFEPMGVRETADVLHISTRRVLQLIESGELPAKKLPGRTGAYVLDPAEVERCRVAREDAEAAAS